MAISGRIGYRSSPNPELSIQSIDLGSLQLVDENSLTAARKSEFLARKNLILCTKESRENFCFQFTCVNGGAFTQVNLIRPKESKFIFR